MSKRTETSCACFGCRPDAFGGYKLDWSEVDAELEKLCDKLYDQGFRFFHGVGSQGVGMRWAEAVMNVHDREHRDMYFQLSSPFKKQSDKWSPKNRDMFGIPAWHRMVNRCYRQAKDAWYPKVNGVRWVHEAGIKAFHMANQQVLSRVSFVCVVWPREKGNWWDAKGATVSVIKKANRKMLPVMLIETETENDKIHIVNKSMIVQSS